MVIIIEPYMNFGPLRFEVSRIEDCIRTFGDPLSKRKSRSGLQELNYPKWIIRFDSQNEILCECTLLPMAEAQISGIPVTWDRAFLQEMSKLDGAPLDIYGFIVLNTLGIAVTGIHDDDASQLAITIFRRGRFDDLLPKGKLFAFNV